MRKNTRIKFNQFMQRQAELNGVDIGDISKKYSVEPSVSQTLITRVQESSDFLTKINIVPVHEQEGEKIGLNISNPIASTTDTSGDETRKTTDIGSLDKDRYRCEQVNFDTHIRYARLDMWAKFPDFQLRLRDGITHRQALDRIMIGFNGTRRADNSNRTAFPLLQDVAIGWLEKYRKYAPQRVMRGILNNAGELVPEIIVGAGGDYKNLDALVMDAANNMIDAHYLEDPDLVVICGRQLLADKYFPIVNQVQANTETLAADLIISQKRIGNLPAVRVPYFPANGFMVTKLENLSIYWQEETHRRYIKDVPERDRVENYESIKEDYVIEDYGCGCLVENIKLK